MAQKIQKKKGGVRKHGRSKRAKDAILSQFVRGLITGETYFKLKGVRVK